MHAFRNIEEIRVVKMSGEPKISLSEARSGKTREVH